MGMLTRKTSVLWPGEAPADSSDGIYLDDYDIQTPVATLISPKLNFLSVAVWTTTLWRRAAVDLPLLQVFQRLPSSHFLTTCFQYDTAGSYKEKQKPRFCWMLHYRRSRESIARPVSCFFRPLLLHMCRGELKPLVHVCDVFTVGSILELQKPRPSFTAIIYMDFDVEEAFQGLLWLNIIDPELTMQRFWAKSKDL